MFDAFRVKRPFYPLVGFAASVLLLVFGMLLSKSLWIFVLVGLVLLIYIVFGLFKAVWKMTAATLAMGLIIGALAFLTNQNIAAFWQTVGRMLLLGVCAVPMVSVPPAQLTRCLNQFKCPRMLTLGMLVTIRFIPILIGEIKRIWEAMRVRGVRMAWYRPDCLYRAFFIPLMMRVIGISDTLSLSLETRGFDLAEKQATVYQPVHLCGRDIVFSCLLAGAIAATEVLAWHMQLS